MKPHKGRRLEQKIYERMAEMRTTLFKPLVRVLDKVGVTPNMVSYTGVLFMCGFAYFVAADPWFAMWLGVVAVVLDLIDGPLARYQKTTSDKGKFIDMICDSVVFTLFCVGLVYAGLVNSLVAMVFVYVMLMNKVLRCIRNGVFFKSKWFFKAVAGFVPNLIVGVMYGVFVFYVFSGLNWLMWGMELGSLVLVVDGFLKYRKILTL